MEGYTPTSNLYLETNPGYLYDRGFVGDNLHVNDALRNTTSNALFPIDGAVIKVNISNENTKALIFKLRS